MRYLSGVLSSMFSRRSLLRDLSTFDSHARLHSNEHGVMQSHISKPAGKANDTRSQTSMSLSFRPFTLDDVPFALSQCRREQWDNTCEVIQLGINQNPDGCFIGECDNQAVGMVTTISYSRSGWIGNLIVDPDHRRRGIGELLMRRGIEFLERAKVKSIYLEADPLGVNVYRRLGFSGQYNSPRFIKTPPHEFECETESAISPATIDLIEEFDASRFGDNRSRFLRGLLDISRAALCWQSHGTMRGVCNGPPFRRWSSAWAMRC